MATEYVPFDEAFDEGAREAAQRIAARLPRTVSVQCVGGPLDGNTVAVPAGALQRNDGAELPLPLPALSDTLVVPGERPRHAVYTLDRAHRVLRFKEIARYFGGAV